MKKQKFNYRSKTKQRRKDVNPKAEEKGMQLQKTTEIVVDKCAMGR